MLSGGARIEMEVKALQQMMAQLWQMQENLEQRRGEIRVEATAGGGMVSVKMNGQKQLTEVKIEPEVFAGKDQEMRSEERRVGKEGRAGWGGESEKEVG